MACSIASQNSTISDKEWFFSGYRCVFDCVEVTESFYKSLVGSPLKLDGSELSTEPFGPCKAGELIIDLESVPTTQRLDQYNTNLPEGMRFTPENTGIRSAKVLTGEIACKDKKLGRRTLLSIVSATENELIALEEDGLLIIFTPLKQK